MRLREAVISPRPGDVTVVWKVREEGLNITFAVNITSLLLSRNSDPKA
jgi:hypothetical protein